MLIVQGELDTQVPPHHADKLLALAQARKQKVDVELLKVPGVNHLLVPAKTGEVSEYSALGRGRGRCRPCPPASARGWRRRSAPGKRPLVAHTRSASGSEPLPHLA